MLRATVEELRDPRYDAPMRALATEILHDPDLIWGPFFHRWLQGSGPLTPEWADAVVDAALRGLR